jgi:hypothetical protein
VFLGAIPKILGFERAGNFVPWLQDSVFYLLAQQVL